MKTVILVNGIPASGKSTIAKAISKELSCPYLSIDIIKEPFMSLYTNIDRNLNRELGKCAYKTLWDIVENTPENCIYVIDAWLGFQSKDMLLNYLKKSGVENIIEIWNQISPELVSHRYEKRLPFRAKGHPGKEYIPELISLAEKAKPMSVGHLIEINQMSQLDVKNLSDRIRKIINI